MTMLAVGDEEEAWPGFLGRVTDASVRTFDYAMHCLIFIVGLRRFPLATKNSSSQLASPLNKLHRRVEARRDVLIRILLFLRPQRSKEGVFGVVEATWLEKLDQEGWPNRLYE
jgi:hypothetical protein